MASRTGQKTESGLQLPEGESTIGRMSGNSLSRAMAKFGINPQEEEDQEYEKMLGDFMSKANSGRMQGKGQFAKVFTPDAKGFQDYIAADAAYNLHQGEGGKAWQDKRNKADFGKMGFMP